ncbi:hypothetical protein Hanom_Chr14g01253311 [Helianthus anomalus]
MIHFFSRMGNQTSQWNGMIHFIMLPVPFLSSFYFLVHSITSYQTDTKSF